MTDFETLKQWCRDDWDATAAWREQAEDDQAFIAGHQWSDEERAFLEENNRVAIVFNRCAPIMSAVAGTEVNNRTEVRFIPREIGDAKPNEVLTAGAKWFRDQALAEDEESTAFEDMLVTGLGFTETTLDFEADDEGAPVTARIDPSEMAWDASARKKGLEDARRFHRVRMMDAAAAQELLPGFEAAEIDADWLQATDDAEDERHVTVPGDQYALGDGVTDRKTDKVRVVQTQWCERSRVVEYVEAGERKEMPAEKWERLAKRMPVALIPHRSVTRKRWRQAFLGRDGILGEIAEPCPERSTFTPMTAKWDRRDRRWYGLLRMMRDPQRFANKWLSQVLHIINANAKGGVMYESDAVPDVREFEEQWSAADAAIRVNPGAIVAGKIRERAGVQMPAALMSLTEFASDAIRGVSGVNLEILGLRDANQPGVLEYQRRQSAMTTLAAYFDSLRFYRKRQGVVILHYLREHIAPTGRLVRIVREDQAQYVPLATAGDTRKYDVVVDDAPSSPNEKEKTWAVLSELMPLLMNAGLSADEWADILEYSPLPASFAQKIREKANKPKEPSPEQQVALRKEAADAAQKESAAALNQARAAEIGAAAQWKPIEAYADAMKAQADMIAAQTDARMAPQRAMVEAMGAASKARRDDMEARLAPMKALTRPNGSSGAGQ